MAMVPIVSISHYFYQCESNIGDIIPGSPGVIELMCKHWLRYWWHGDGTIMLANHHIYQ